MRPLTIGITTRNRPLAIERCVRSLACLGPLVSRVLVFDDGSDVPVETIVAQAAPAGMDVAVIRDETQGLHRGPQPHGAGRCHALRPPAR